MFGDKILLGQSDIVIDDKSRMFLPARTNREKGDNLVLLYDSTLECYKIYSVSAIEETFDRLEKLLDGAKSEQEEAWCKKRLFDFSKSILKECTVDSEGRIALGTTINPNSSALIIGARDHLILQLKK